jgi:predicted nucleotidyltransferase
VSWPALCRPPTTSSLNAAKAWVVGNPGRPQLPPLFVHICTCAKPDGATMAGTAFLSARAPENVRNRVKALSAQRGERAQDLVGGLIERFLKDAERQPPQLADVLGRLRALEPTLRNRGVAAVRVFGSVARGDARPDSDVDVAIDFAPTSKTSLFDIIRLKEELEAALGRPVDIGERSSMTRQAAAAADRDLTRVF